MIKKIPLSEQQIVPAFKSLADDYWKLRLNMDKLVVDMLDLDVWIERYSVS